MVSGDELSQRLENAAAPTMAAVAAAVGAAAAAAAKTEAESVLLTEAESVFFMDDEEVFHKPELLRSMAEGMLLPPPHCHEGKNMETDSDVSLWIY